MKNFFTRITPGVYEHETDSAVVYVVIRVMNPHAPRSHQSTWRMTRNGEHFDSGLRSKEHCRQSIIERERRDRLAFLQDRFARMTQGGKHSPHSTGATHGRTTRR